MTNLSTRVNDLSDKEAADILGIQKDFSEMKVTMNILAGRVSRAETVNDRLNDDISNLRSHSMKSNIIISFDKNDDRYKSEQGEQCKNMAKRFFAETMKIAGVDSLFIPVAHRVGPKHNKSRPLLVKLPVAADFSNVMAHAKNLAGSGHFVTKQLPADRRERKQYVLPIFKDRRANTDQKVQMIDDRLLINGVLQRQYLPATLQFPT